MVQVVMLASFAGNGIDIVPGDACVCTSDEADRLIAFGSAREFTSNDEGRCVKYLHLGDKHTVASDENLSQIPTAVLAEVDPKIGEKSIAALVATDLTDLAAVSAKTNAELKALDSLGPAVVKRIRTAIAAVRSGDFNAAPSTEEDNVQANQGSPAAADGAASQEA